MATIITSNGSKWAGQDPDTLEQLLDVLTKEPLDPTFERCGNFVIPDDQGFVNFFGNFANVSHVFNIDSNEPREIERLTAAIRANQKTDAYKTAITAWAERERRGAAYAAEQDRKNRETYRMRSA